MGGIESPSLGSVGDEGQERAQALTGAYTVAKDLNDRAMFLSPRDADACSEAQTLRGSDERGPTLSGSATAVPSAAVSAAESLPPALGPSSTPGPAGPPAREHSQGAPSDLDPVSLPPQHQAGEGSPRLRLSSRAPLLPLFRSQGFVSPRHRPGGPSGDQPDGASREPGCSQPGAGLAALNWPADATRDAPKSAVQYIQRFPEGGAPYPKPVLAFEDVLAIAPLRTSPSKAGMGFPTSRPLLSVTTPHTSLSLASGVSSHPQESTPLPQTPFNSSGFGPQPLHSSSLSPAALGTVPLGPTNSSPLHLSLKPPGSKLLSLVGPGRSQPPASSTPQREGFTLSISTSGSLRPYPLSSGISRPMPAVGGSSYLLDPSSAGTGQHKGQRVDMLKTERSVGSTVTRTSQFLYKVMEVPRPVGAIHGHEQTPVCRSGMQESVQTCEPHLRALAHDDDTGQESSRANPVGLNEQRELPAAAPELGRQGFEMHQSFEGRKELEATSMDEDGLIEAIKLKKPKQKPSDVCAGLATENAASCGGLGAEADRALGLTDTEKCVEAVQLHAKTGAATQDLAKYAPEGPRVTEGLPWQDQAIRVVGAKRFTHRRDVDGHSWRKYSHKILKGTQTERVYYYCMQKESVGCLARKVVDRPKNRHWRGDSPRDVVSLQFSHNHPPLQADSSENPSST